MNGGVDNKKKIGFESDDSQMPSAPDMLPLPQNKEKRESDKGLGVKLALLAGLILLNVYAVLCVNSAPLVNSFNIRNNSYELAPGTSKTIEADIGFSLPVIASGHEIEWNSSNPDILEIDENGCASALSEGSVTVSASILEGKFTSECLVTVKYIGTIEFSKPEVELGMGESMPVSWTGGNGVKFSSDDDSIVQVSQNGTLTANKVGSAKITVSSAGWIDGSCTVNVMAAPEQLVLDYEVFSMGLEEVYNIGVEAGEGASSSTYTYTSSDASVAKVDASGKITAVSKGTAQITVTAYNGASAAASVTVTDAPQKLTLASDSASIFSGQTVRIEPKVDTGAVAYKYTSSDEKIATVDSNGVVTGRGRGSAKITCESYNGLTAEFSVGVKIVNFTQKYSPKKLNDDIYYLAQSFPELITTEVVGKSELGKDLTMVKLGRGERIALIVAGFHSNESTAVNFTMRCIEEYAAAYYSEDGMYGSYNMRKLLDKFTLYIVPLVNPDGLEIVNCDVLPPWTNGEEPESETQGVYWRDEYTANANGVNLNRNFPFRWDKTLTSTEGPHINLYKGETEGSESETQALIKLCSEHEFEWMFSMHVRGYFIFWRDEYSKTVPGDYDIAVRLRNVCGFKLLGPSKLKNLGGGFENWFRAEYDRPGFCIELIDPKYTKFVNENFERNVNWKRTKYTFIQGMMDK